MLDFLKPETAWEFVFLIFLGLVSFLIGWLFSKWQAKKKYRKELAHCYTTIDQLSSNLELKYTGDATIDFTTLGMAEASQKDDLTQIKGIGPYVENRLNEIGIYTFHQIGKLTDTDIDNITELIEFFPGRIKRDNWKGQAQSLTKQLGY